MNMNEAKAAVVYLSLADPRVTIAEEIESLPEIWLHGLGDYTYEQVKWGIKEYYGKLATDQGADSLRPAMCRKILQGAKTVAESKRANEAELEPKKGGPPPSDVKARLDQALGRVGQGKP